LVQEGVGETILTGNNTAFAGPITFTNFLQVGNGIAGTLGTGNVTNNGTLIFNVSGSLPVNANIAGSGSVSNVAGTVTLNGTGTYAGSTAVAGGKIVLGSATALPSTGAVILNDGNAPVGTLDLDGNSFTVPSLTGNNTGQGNSTLNESLIVNNGSGTSILTISGNNTNTYNGQILDNNNAGSGKVGLAVVNGANFTLNSCYNAASAFPFANVFSGGITVSNATLSLGVNNGSATPGGVGTAAAGGNPNGTQTIVMTGTNDLLYAAAAGGSTTPTLQTTVGTLNVTTNTTAFIYGAQRGQFNSATLTGSGNIIYQPNYVRDRLTFGNASAFTGTITFEQHQNTSGGGIGYDGPLGFPNAPVIFGITNASFPTFYGSTTVGNGVVFPMGSLAGGDNTAELAGSSQNVGANVIYSIGGLNTSTTYGGLIVDAVGIRKVGTGSLTLTNNTLSWSGQTVVSNGTLAFAPLAVTNQALGPVYLLSSNYTLVSPGILDVSAAGGTLYLAHNNNGFQSLYGNGTLNGSLVASNSLIAPGRRASMSSIFTGSALTVTNTVTLHSGTTNLFGINRTNTPPNDSLAALSIAYAGTLIVTNFGDTNYASGSSNVFRLFSGALSGTFASVTLPVLPAGMYWVTNLYVDGSIAIVNTNSSISTNAFTITNSFNSVNGTLTLSWPLNHTGYRLEAQTNTLAVGISTNWVDIDSQFTPPANTTNQVAIPVYTGNASVFYRLIYP
jgi:autotransporter-associated beta strand protein